MTARSTLLLADDHKIVVEGLRTLLEPHVQLVGIAADGRELVEKARSLMPEVIITDISMPLLNGIDAVRQLRDEGHPARVIFLTMHPDATYLSRALETGAAGYVLKHSAPDELLAAIEAVLRDEQYISPALRGPRLDELLDETRRRSKDIIEPTPRQREVLQLLAEGKSAKEIGAILEISARTVETHKYKMMDDLGVKTTAELIQHAVRLGLIDP